MALDQWVMLPNGGTGIPGVTSQNQPTSAQLRFTKEHLGPQVTLTDGNGLLHIFDSNFFHGITGKSPSGVLVHRPDGDLRGFQNGFVQVVARPVDGQASFGLFGLVQNLVISSQAGNIQETIFGYYELVVSVSTASNTISAAIRLKQNNAVINNITSVKTITYLGGPVCAVIEWTSSDDIAVNGYPTIRVTARLGQTNDFSDLVPIACTITDYNNFEVLGGDLAAKFSVVSQSTLESVGIGLPVLEGANLNRGDFDELEIGLLGQSDLSIPILFEDWEPPASGVESPILEEDWEPPSSGTPSTILAEDWES